MKAYKVFDENLICNPDGIPFQYEVGKTYTMEEEPILCKRGFHACKKVQDCFSYYSFDPENRICEVELSGIILGIEDNKQCSNIITISRELTWQEMLEIANTGKGCSGHSNSGDSNSGDSNSGHSNSGHSNSGHSNSGDSNSGHRNSGNRNSGHRNSGHWNSGDRNSGNWNSCDNEVGNFNTTTSSTIRIFNKDCNRIVWENCSKPNFIYFDLNKWIYFSDMSEQEKIDFPKAYVCDGYLKTYSYKEAWAESFKSASKKDIELLKALPNFDADVFFEISGIKIE